MKEILTRTLTGILLVALVVGSILAGPWSFLALVLAIYILGTSELFRLLSRGGYKPCGLHALAGALLILIVFFGLQGQSSPLWMGLVFLLWLGGIIKQGSTYAASLFLFWLALPLSALLALGWLGAGHSYQALMPLSAITLVWINDIFAYLTGRFAGRHPMTPKLSPGKTWEGFSGGILFTILAGIGMHALTDAFSATAWGIMGLLIALLAFSGDLFESSLKRRFGLKDTGRMLPGHGGILDRFDSLFFVTPALVIILLIINFIS